MYTDWMGSPFSHSLILSTVLAPSGFWFDNWSEHWSSQPEVIRSDKGGGLPYNIRKKRESMFWQNIKKDIPMIFLPTVNYYQMLSIIIFEWDVTIVSVQHMLFSEKVIGF